MSSNVPNTCRRSTSNTRTSTPAIERRDSEAARAAMRIHLVNSRERQRKAHGDPANAEE